MRIVARLKGEIVGSAEAGDRPLYFGRSKANDIVLSHIDVSRRHAKLFVEEGRLYLEDLKSANGTKLKGKRVARAELREGDTFTIGPFDIAALASPPGDLLTAPEADFDTTFAEAATDLGPGDHTLPPAKPGAGQGGELRALRHFLRESGGPDRPAGPGTGEETQGRFVRLDGESAGQEIPLTGGETVIGSSHDSGIVVEEDSVAPRQAVVERKEDTYLLKSFGETTGTYVDGVPVRRRELENHDVVEIGSAKFEFLRGTARSRVRGPSVIERVPTRVSALRRIAFDIRFLAPAGILLGALLVWLARGDRPGPAAPPPAAPSPPPAEGETARLTRFHLERASRLIGEKKYDEAEARIRVVLEKISPRNADALQLMEQVEASRAEERREARARRNAEAQRAAKIRDILEEGGRLGGKKQYAAARRVYEQALQIDSESRAAKAAIESLERAREREKSEAAARRKTDEQLQKLYTEGVMKFEAGDLGAAERLLEQVAGRKGHKYQASAKRLLDEIHRVADRKLEERVGRAKEAADSGDLLAAKAELQAILKQFPANEKAGRLLGDTNEKLAAKAAQSYKEGIAYLEVAEDPEAALEKFEETLRYAPGRADEYRRKARHKIDELKKKK